MLAVRGNAYNGELMIVGRAVNGWTLDGEFENGIMPAELKDAGIRDRFASAVCQKSVVNDSGECPLSWVENRGNSPFWQVTRRVCEQLNIRDTNNWFSYLVWSNLYKIAPAAGGRLNERLCNTQYSGCVELFSYEIEHFRPICLLMVTDKFWANDFINHRNKVLDHKVNRDLDFIDRFGKMTTPNGHKVRFVVTKRPENHSRAVWTRQVIQTIDSIR